MSSKEPNMPPVDASPPVEASPPSPPIPVTKKEHVVQHPHPRPLELQASSHPPSSISTSSASHQQIASVVLPSSSSSSSAFGQRSSSTPMSAGSSGKEAGHARSSSLSRVDHEAAARDGHERKIPSVAQPGRDQQHSPHVAFFVPSPNISSGGSTPSPPFPGLPSGSLPLSSHSLHSPGVLAEVEKKLEKGPYTLPRDYSMALNTINQSRHPLFRVFPGHPYPLGASWDGVGTNFALFSEDATAVELCFFDSIDSTHENSRIQIPEYTDHVWHVYLRGCKPGSLYGYRVYGPSRPSEGLRFNPSKVLMDPYAKCVARPTKWDASMFGYEIMHKDEDLSIDDRDNSAFCALASVVDDAFSWGDDKAPRTPLHKSVIYEMHVKGFTMLNAEVPASLRGTYAGLASEPAIRHLKSLGVTAVELLPVHHHTDEWHLLQRGLRNYWGYNTLGFFAPDSRFSSAGAVQAVQEFKTMVRAFHQEGIEVILDVVYNHTAEGNHMGPTLSFKGIDNRSYYRLVEGNPRYYMDFSGCGNTLNARNPRVLQLIMDSLRYWVQVMRVDGFRFDLCSALARGLFEVDKLSAFFDCIHQDPVLSTVKLIAEPWDCGSGGYQVGNFPVNWCEWNGIYRDSVRSFWNRKGVSLGNFATRLAGSSDLYEHSGRRPVASINFITAHDGYTLRDLVSYEQKHNEANGHNNEDGESHNLSCNFGCEGVTDSMMIKAIRMRQMRNFMATLLLSQGVPMIRMGDEIAQTTRGNNNPYNQDNEINWLSWKIDPECKKFLHFVKRMIKFRLSQPVLQRRKFVHGKMETGGKTFMPEVLWLDERGEEISIEQWHDPERHIMGVLLEGDGIDERDEQGRLLKGDTLLFYVNSGEFPTEVLLPDYHEALQWKLELDSHSVSSQKEGMILAAGSKYRVEDLSLSLFVRVEEKQSDSTQASPAFGALSMH